MHFTQSSPLGYSCELKSIEADNKLFSSMLSGGSHCIHQLLQFTHYNLCKFSYDLDLYYFHFLYV